MIISRTPFRISLFSSGTDYPAWFKEYGGAVVGTAIDKYATSAFAACCPSSSINRRSFIPRLSW